MTDTNTSGADMLAVIDRFADNWDASGKSLNLGECMAADELRQARTAVAALIEREAALETDLARVSEELGLPPKIGPVPGVIRALISGRDALKRMWEQAEADLSQANKDNAELIAKADALAAEVKALRDAETAAWEISAFGTVQVIVRREDVAAEHLAQYQMRDQKAECHELVRRASAATGGGNG